MNHTKLRLLSVILAVFAFITALPCLTASADSSQTTYELTEIAMTIDIPSQTSVIIPSVKKSDKLFRDGTFDYLTALSKMREDNAFLYGKNLIDGYEIEVMSVKNENKIKNLSKLKSNKQSKILEKFSQQDDVVEASLYTNGNLTFIYTSRTTNGASGRFFYSDYYTVYNGNDITVRLISENDNITKEELAVLKTAVDSIKLPEKRKFDFKTLSGKGVFGAFVFLFAAFVLIILYRRHEEQVNAVIIPAAAKIKAATASSADKIKEKAITEKNRLSEKAEKVKEAKESRTDDSLETTEEKIKEIVEEQPEEEEEDLSSIDLDAAIALFDDSSNF